MSQASPPATQGTHDVHNNKRSTDSPAGLEPSKQIKVEGKLGPAAGPSSISATSTPEPSIMKREHRDKRDSWKKRESRGESVEAFSGSRSINNNNTGTSNGVITNDAVASDNPVRTYALTYKESDVNAVPRRPVFASLAHADVSERSYEQLPNVNLYVLEEVPFNRRGFRYIPCCTDPSLPHTIYRQIEIPPYKARINFQDMSPHVFVDSQGTIASTDKGFRSARANVGFRQGDWYFEFEILRGNNPLPQEQETDSIPHQNGTSGSGDSTRSQTPAPTTSLASSYGSGHVRLGLSRREANLETPVGYDAYSYGLRDKYGQKVHLSRPSTFMKGDDDGFSTGDIIGFHIRLPPLCDQLPKSLNTSNVIRERIPIKYKGQSYFETLEYRPTKAMNELLNPASVTAAAAREAAAEINKEGNKNSAKEDNEIPPDHLEGSFINVYKNGKLVGTAFENLPSFMPPWYSRPNSHLTTHSADDGMAGYFPTLSVFGGGAVKMNLGPEFIAPPEGLKVESQVGKKINLNEVSHGNVLPASDRFHEQIAEDVVYDIMDEIYFSIVDEQEGKQPTAVQNGASGGTSSRLSSEAKSTPPIKVKEEEYQQVAEVDNE